MASSVSRANRCGLSQPPSATTKLTLALVPKERLVGVGSSTKSVTYSNVASLVQDIAENHP